MDRLVALFNKYNTGMPSHEWPEMLIAYRTPHTACNFLAIITGDDNAHCHDTWECTTPRS